MSKPTPLEKVAENAFVKEVERNGDLALKMIQKRSWPDRLVLMPGGGYFFIEFKRLGEKLRPDQIQTCEDLKRMGHHVYSADTYEKAIDIYYKEKSKVS